MRAIVFNLALVCMLLSSNAGWAQDPNRQQAREREIMRRAQEAQAAKQKLESEKAQIEQDKSKVEAELKEIKDKASKTSGAIAKEKRRANDLQAKLTKSSSEVTTLTEEKNALSARVRELEASVAAQTSETKRTQSTLSQRDAELSGLKEFSARQTVANDSCVDNNKKLYVLSRELMEKYRNQGMWETVRRAEPFTQARQVEVENLLEQYRDRADASRAAPAPRRQESRAETLPGDPTAKKQ